MALNSQRDQGPAIKNDLNSTFDNRGYQQNMISSRSTASNMLPRLQQQKYTMQTKQSDNQYLQKRPLLTDLSQKNVESLKSKIESKSQSRSTFLLSRRSCLTSMVQHEERQKTRKKRQVLLPSTTLGERRKDTSYSTLNRQKAADKNYLKQIKTVFDHQTQKYVIKSIKHPSNKNQIQPLETLILDKNSPICSKTEETTTRERVDLFLGQISAIENKHEPRQFNRSQHAPSTIVHSPHVTQMQQSQNQNGGDQISLHESGQHLDESDEQQDKTDVLNEVVKTVDLHSPYRNSDLAQTNQSLETKRSSPLKQCYLRLANHSSRTEKSQSNQISTIQDQVKPTDFIPATKINPACKTPSLPEIETPLFKQDLPKQCNKQQLKQKQVQLLSRESQELKQLKRFIDFQRLKLKPYFVVTKKEKTNQINCSSSDSHARMPSKSSAIQDDHFIPKFKTNVYPHVFQDSMHCQSNIEYCGIYQCPLDVVEKLKLLPRQIKVSVRKNVYILNYLIQPLKSLESIKLEGKNPIQTIDQIIKYDEIINQAAANANQIFIQEQCKISESESIKLKLFQNYGHNQQSSKDVRSKNVKGSQKDQMHTVCKSQENKSRKVIQAAIPSVQRVQTSDVQQIQNSKRTPAKKQDDQSKNTNSDRFQSRNPKRVSQAKFTVQVSEMISFDKSIRTLEIPEQTKLTHRCFRGRKQRKGKSLELGCLKDQLKNKVIQDSNPNVSVSKNKLILHKEDQEHGEVGIQPKKSLTAQNFYGPIMKIQDMEYTGPVASNSFQKLKDYNQIRCSEMQFQSSHHKSVTTSDWFNKIANQIHNQPINSSHYIRSTHLLKHTDQMTPNYPSQSPKLPSNPASHNKINQQRSRTPIDKCSFSVQSQDSINKFEKNSKKLGQSQPSTKSIRIELLASKHPNPQSVGQPPSISSQKVIPKSLQACLIKRDCYIDGSENQINNMQTKKQNEGEFFLQDRLDNKRKDQQKNKVVLSKYSSTLNNDNVTFNQSHLDGSFRQPLQEDFHTFVKNTHYDQQSEPKHIYDSENKVLSNDQATQRVLINQQHRQNQSMNDGQFEHNIYADHCFDLNLQNKPKVPQIETETKLEDQQISQLICPPQESNSCVAQQIANPGNIKMKPQFSNTVIGSFMKKSQINWQVKGLHKSPRTSIKDISGSLNQSHIDSSGNYIVKEAQQIAAVYNQLPAEQPHVQLRDKTPGRSDLNGQAPTKSEGFKKQTEQKYQSGMSKPEGTSIRQTQQNMKQAVPRLIKLSAQKPKRISLTSKNKRALDSMKSHF